MAERRGGLSFNQRTWKNTTQSVLKGEIPFTSEYIKTIGAEICECDAKCHCHWTGDEVGECPCVVGNRECKLKCKGCKKVLKQGLSDNRQIQRGGLTPKKTRVDWLNEKMGHSLVSQESAKSGDALIGFAGNVILEKDLPEDHTVYVLSLGYWKFKLKKDYGNYKKGKVFKGNWIMDCTEIGSDANFVNSTCGHNNARTYTVLIKRIPTPVLYAIKDIGKGV